MAVVILVAALLRLSALPALPVGLHYDEAANLVLTREIVAGDDRPLFIRAYTGKEVLFFYAAAPWVAMTDGAGAWGLRLASAMVGVLTVAATFAATRGLLGRRTGAAAIALFAAGWLAVAFPHVLLSRLGFRAISQPLLQALTVATLWRGLRLGRWRWTVAAGVCLGLTGYTYLAARLFPLPLAIAGIWLLARMGPAGRRRLLVRAAVVLGVVVIVFAPLGIFFLRHPDAFTTRMSQVVSPSLSDALRGIGQCLQALVLPGAGDRYVRFNEPGVPILDSLSALWLLLGVGAMVLARRRDRLEGAGRLLVLVAIPLMLLPSALATGEITPSNLRMVGLYPFLAIPVGWGLYTALALLMRLRAVRGYGFLPAVIAGGLLLAGAGRTASTYFRWASSAALFRAADGEMAVAARVLDQTIASAADGGAPVTVYVASEHFRHPTVAALARHYGQAKWLTGGASLVLPPEGDAVYLLPESLPAPAPWPDAVMGAWTTRVHSGPAGMVALKEHRLLAADVARAREAMLVARVPADFAHVVLVHDARPAVPCRAGAPCTVTVIWQPLAPTTSLQPVVRLLHPETGEWARAMAFHYPPEMWTPGDWVIDYLVLDVPVAIPPVDGYRLGVSLFDPGSAESLPRVEDELFAGLEAQFPAGATGYALARAPEPPDEGQAATACPTVSRESSAALNGLGLLGWTVSPPEGLLPGSALSVALCWQAKESAPPYDTVALRLTGPAEETLYVGTPAAGYGFGRWRAGEVVEDRHALRLPRTLPPGDYTLWLALDGADRIALAGLSLAPVIRSFTVPDMTSATTVDFVGDRGEGIRLLGYDLAPLIPGQPWPVTLAWQALGEMDEDYVVFLHLRTADADAPALQADTMPLQGGYPTSLWVSNEVVVDTHTLAPPADLAPGDYMLYVGFYTPEGERLLTEGMYRARLAEVRVMP